MIDNTDPVLKHSRREAMIIVLAWFLSTAYCCGYAYAFGYRREGRFLGVEDIQPVFGIPSWVLWGIIVPWIVSALFSLWFAGYYMTDDDLGKDHSLDLDSKIREGEMHE
ncbi:MAG: hypothetical protein NVSMB9_04730 [Isosphaeraceae bacterium]